MTNRSNKGDYIIEFIPNGKFVKVSVIDPETLMEVSIVGPVHASKMELQSTVLKKLEYVMNKESEKRDQKTTPASKGKGGIIV